MRLLKYGSAFLLLFSTLTWFSCSTNKGALSSDRNQGGAWAAIDSLNNIGQYGSALNIVNEILESSQQNNDWKTEFKARMTQSRLRQQIGEDYPELIDELQQGASSTKFPLNNLLHSAVASAYWSYYQQNRWWVLERTNTSGTPDDIRTWGQQRFLDAIVHHYGLSLQDEDRLMAMPANELGELGIGENYELRPTLYDLLAHRALDVYKNPESRLAEPAWRFRMNSESLFDLFEEFAYRPVKHRDSTSLSLQAINIYKSLARLHLGGDDATPLVVLELDRLLFVRQNSTHPRKDSLYIKALGKLASRVRNDPVGTDVSYAIAQWHVEQGNKYQRLVSDLYKWDKRKAVEVCEDAIAGFPESLGATNCQALIDQLKEGSLMIRTESAVSPMEESLTSLRYRNVNRVHLRLYQLPIEVDYVPATDQRSITKLLGRKTAHEWVVNIEDDGDMNDHVLELPIPKLDLGRYLLVISDSSRFKPGKDIVAHTHFWVTDISFAVRGTDQDEQEILILSRKKGTTLKSARIERYRQDWLGSKREFVKVDESYCNSDAPCLIPIENQERRYFRYRISYRDDVFVVDAGGYFHDSEPNATTRTHIFTDRSIYRPGQEIHFKGLVIRGSVNDHTLLADHRSVINLIDVNGEEVSSIEVVSDDHGSFSGTFKAPKGLLNGVMHLRTESGNRSVRVEEYKRPRFEVLIDPADGQPRLDESVSITGKANSYAGLPVDGASVQWKIIRKSRMPIWCWGYWRTIIPWGTETEIASGTAVTDTDGTFSFDFLAIPDNQIPIEASPLFVYQIEASVTDINGETQQGMGSITCAYQTLQVDIALDKTVWQDTFTHIPVSIKNLNGQPVKAPIKVEIKRLNTPETPFKERIWELPDRFMLSEDEHKRRFGLVPYTTENDPLTWSIESTIFSIGQDAFDGEPIKVNRAIPVGDYVVEVTTEDDNGQPITVKRHVVLREKDRGRAASAELFHAELLEQTVEPGNVARSLLSSSMPQTRFLVEVERDGRITDREWYVLNSEQVILDFPVTEADRGGFSIHVFAVREERQLVQTLQVHVPWSNKQLQFEWMSFRDKLLPGDQQEWRLKVKGEKGNAVAAQLAAVMYDASLDQFVDHEWTLDLWTPVKAKRGFGQPLPSGASYSRTIWREKDRSMGGSRSYPGLNFYGFGHYFFYGAMDAVAVQSNSGSIFSRGNKQPSAPAMEMMEDAEPGALEPDEVTTDQTTSSSELEDTQNTTSQPVVRTDFRETAFFFPDLLSDTDGSIVLRFKTPDALTSWKVLGLAHTKELELGKFIKQAISQRPLMVSPNLPRFMREGDRILLTTKISTAESRHEGYCELQLFDPFTGENMNNAFNFRGTAGTFVVSPGASEQVQWEVTVPQGLDAVGVRITARAPAGPMNKEAAADGEEHVLPILSDRLLVTESLPLPVNEAGVHTFDFKKLRASNESQSLQHKALTLEFTANPAWYAVQALPYIMEFPHECSEQIFNRYYSNALASHITKRIPAVKQVFEEWKVGGGQSLVSDLEKNQELKDILLEETPWLLEARNETEQKQRIGVLFDLERMAEEEALTFRKLLEKQYPEGGWGWFNGMRPSRGITQEIVTGVGHLEKLGVANTTDRPQMDAMVKRAVNWLDLEVEREHKKLKQRLTKEELSDYRPNYWDVHYLYARSFFDRWPQSGGAKEAVSFLMERIGADWLQYGLQEQALIAIILDRAGNHTVAGLVLKSLKERSTDDRELGMYWKGFDVGWRWSQLPVETHALMVEAFNEVGQDDVAVRKLRQHLLKLKKTTNWGTTKATANACYSLLLGGDNWLEPQHFPRIELGGVTIDVPSSDREAGSGYFKTNWKGDAVTPDMGNIRIETSGDQIAWGALHWQYLEQMDKISGHDSPFSIAKSINVKRSGDTGDVLVPLESSDRIRVGDLLSIRLELRTDRFLDYVHLKDLRSAGTEPVQRLSGYRFKEGLGYYQSIKDAATHFFFDRIAPGTYVLEYELRVTHAGGFSNGITTGMCMYAPEFNSHSGGRRISVEQ